MSIEPSIRIFTFKEGLLSRLGHDLQLSLQRFEITVDDDAIHGRFWPDSLQVDGAMKGGKLAPRELDDGDRAKIRRTAIHDVLDCDRYGEARLEAHLRKGGNGWLIDGTLTLMGRRRALPVATALVLGDMAVVDLTIEPSRWGIRPYRAMAGALRLQDRVRIEVAVPSPGEMSATGHHRWAAGQV